MRGHYFFVIAPEIRPSFSGGSITNGHETAIANVFRQRGDISQAVAVAAQGLDLCDRYDMTFLWPRLASLNGNAIALSGRHAEGVALTERALQASLAMRLGQEETLRRAYAGEAYLLAGRIKEARDTALGAVEILGDIARLHPALLADSAESYYREALRRADERDMRPLAAHCHLGLGRLYRRSVNEAREYLTKATNMYREINMQFWLQKTEAQIC